MITMIDYMCHSVHWLDQDCKFNLIIADLLEGLLVLSS